ncbi:unnamed protein product, partial [Didymodactylos carnosus]
ADKNNKERTRFLKLQQKCVHLENRIAKLVAENDQMRRKSVMLPPTGSLPWFETVCHQMRGNPVAECYSKCCDEIGMPISTLRSLVVEKSA